jgi:hypothetical protein
LCDKFLCNNLAIMDSKLFGLMVTSRT